MSRLTEMKPEDLSRQIAGMDFKPSEKHGWIRPVLLTAAIILLAAGVFAIRRRQIEMSIPESSYVPVEAHLETTEETFESIDETFTLGEVAGIITEAPQTVPEETVNPAAELLPQDVGGEAEKSFAIILVALAAGLIAAVPYFLIHLRKER